MSGKDIRHDKSHHVRIVWFQPEVRTEGQPLAAIVTFVHSDTEVNLGIFDVDGFSVGRTRIPLYQGEGEKPSGEYCEWMPYQLGQAAKTEAVEAKLETGGTTMPSHQQRVVDEKNDLAKKLTRLNAFIGGTIYDSLPADERYRLCGQATVMKDYLDILNDRIKAF